MVAISHFNHVKMSFGAPLNSIFETKFIKLSERQGAKICITSLVIGMTHTGIQLGCDQDKLSYLSIVINALDECP